VKRLLLGSAVALGLYVASALPAAASAADRAYIKSKLQFVYLPDPNNPAAVTVDGQKVADEATFHPNPALTPFRDTIQALLSDKLAGGLTAEAQERLQSVVAQTLRITDKPIRVVFVNDLSVAITNAKVIDDYDLALSDHTIAPGVVISQRVWPAAMVVGADPDAATAKPYGGSFAMGAYRVTKDLNNFPNFTALLWVFCHELTHTQDLSYMRWIEFRVLHYGNDGAHFFTEAIPSMASSFKEGVANFIGWSFARRNMDQVSSWFGTDGYVLVEKPPASAKPGDLPHDVFNYNSLDQSQRQTVTFEDKNINDNYGVWKISGLPPRVLLHNEQIIALILYFRAMSTPNGFQEVMASFKRMNPSTFRVSTSAWAKLIDQLGTDMLPSTLTRESVARAEAGPALLPIALCDYFTGFKVQNEAEFLKLFAGADYVKDWVHSYCASAQPAVREAVNKWKAANPAPTGLTGAALKTAQAKRQQDITRVIATTLGVK
jgi:hypothetical protein